MKMTEEKEDIQNNETLLDALSGLTESATLLKAEKWY